MAWQTWLTEFQGFTGILIAASAVAVAIASWRVADRQALTARQKLRLELYPFRLKVYEAAHQAIVSAMNFKSDSAVFDSDTMLFRDKLREARFLFGEDAFNYLNALLTSILQYRHAESLARKNENYYSLENLAEFRSQHALNEKFVLDSLQGLQKELAPYLTVEEGQTTSLIPVVQKTPST